jgi:ketosteroid isomerase-like protein
MTSADSGIRALLDSQVAAMRTKDIDRLMSLYSPDVVYFDVVPPLQFAGSAALRARFLRWFDGWDGDIGMEVRDVAIAAGADLAVAHWFSRARGTLRDGRPAGFWVRVTSCCGRSGAGWSITHEHVSLPVDPASRVAVTDLLPG